ncbi:uncharacterized protein EI90DRAFT_3012965 [Cantharellus anzutake]|uniref:uncharacterized protein n=1 Tax=Cantharellus anzutake TaxID=1750568 RepID=UPI001904B107|nr:uncharacterized protein EI90DRAFT_3012965 [Cantharellus anzutake]KAF8338802.1 hypothetical protein EI90DRAFT_3012965 [Cantharellus anzutake]
MISRVQKVPACRSFHDIPDLKHEAPSALPQSSALKEVQSAPRGVPSTVQHVPLKDNKTVKPSGLSNREQSGISYVRYKAFADGNPRTDFKLYLFKLAPSTNMSIVHL